MIYDINTAYGYLKKELIILMLFFLFIVLLHCIICLLFKCSGCNREFQKHRLQTSKIKDINKKNKKSKKEKKRLWKYSPKEIWGATFVISLLLILYIVPIALDICTESIFIYEGYYCIEESYYSRSKYYSKVTFAGEEYDLCLIDKSQIPPDGEYYGTLIYSKYTKKLFFYSHDHVNS